MLLVMGLGHIGFLPMPGGGQPLTIMHIPVILAAIVDGPVAGSLLGALFGLLSWLTLGPNDPALHFMPRILMGAAAGFVYLIMYRTMDEGARITVASAVAASVASIINTMGFSLLAVSKGFLHESHLLTVVFLNGSLELIIAVLIVVPASIGLVHKK